MLNEQQSNSSNIKNCHKFLLILSVAVVCLFIPTLSLFKIKKVIYLTVICKGSSYPLFVNVYLEFTVNYVFIYLFSLLWELFDICTLNVSF